MIIDTDKIRHLRTKYDYRLECTFFNDFVIEGKRFRGGENIGIADLKHFEKYNCTKVEVQYNERFYNYLSDEYPLLYRKPYGFMDFISMDRHLEVLESISLLSKRKRFIYLIGDISSNDSTAGKKTILAMHNEKIDYKRWNNIKRFIDKDLAVYYRNSENKIIVFVNMRPDAETSYIDRFKKNTDLVTTLVARRKDSKVEIAPDFIPTEDVISVTDPSSLLETYIDTEARLIIIGDELTDSYRKAILDVKQYDRYVRLIIAPSINLYKIDHFLLQVKMVYNSNRWTQ